MKIKILFFGATADAAGKRETRIDLSEGLSVADAFTSLMNAYPALEHHKLLFAVNQEYVSSDYLVRDGDEIAIFTTVSGG